MLGYNKENIGRAKVLRRNMTEQENKLWYQFLREYPLKFQRQKAIGEFIADFYCARAGLVIELDGGQYYTEDGKSYDNFRTEKLKQFGVTVLRIPNGYIDRRFENACIYIDDLARKLAAERGIEY